MLVEVCVSSIEDIFVVEDSGADRVELCSVMEVIGVTPSLGAFEYAKQKIELPIVIMIRPRAGGYNYTKHEFETMKLDIKIFKDNDAKGFVFGILNKENEIDIERCASLVRLIGPGKDIVFHKAFDHIEDKDKAMRQLIDLEFTRVLTSGGEGATVDYIKNLRSLISKYGDQIEIMPGGGINSNNIEQLKRELNINQVHLSAKHNKFDLREYIATDIKHLTKFVKIAKS